MRIGTAVVAVVLLLGAAGCGEDGGDSTDATPAPTESSEAPWQATSAPPTPSPTPDERTGLRKAAQGYSDAYLTGDGEGAYGYLSERCRDRMSSEEFTALVDDAAELYGKAIPFTTFDAEISGNMARATYTYEQVPSINQDSEPWVREGGKWKQDDC